MCGIAGWISDKPVRLPALNTALLLHAATRGNQSAGIFLHGRGLFKRNVPVEAFVQLPKYSHLAVAAARLCLLHTRFPTSGAHGPRQAQPFCCGTTASVHNGMLLNTGELKAQWGVRKPSGVDSELITSVLHEYGPEVLGAFLESTEGPSAVATAEGLKLHLVSYGNPIAYCFVRYKSATVLVFASTEKILHDALKLCGMIREVDKIRTLKVRQVFRASPDGLEETGPRLNERGWRVTRWGGWSWEDDDAGTCEVDRGAACTVGEPHTGQDETNELDDEYEAMVRDYLC